MPAPSVEIEQGATPSTASIALGYMGGMVSISLEASIVDGQLHLDPPQIPDMLGGARVRSEIEEWLDGFNSVLRHNRKQLSSLEVDGGVVTLTKAPLAAETDETPTTTPPVVPATSPTPQPTGPTAEPQDAEEPKSQAFTPPFGCLGMIVAFVLVLGLVLAGIFLAVRGGDEDGEPTEASADPSAVIVETPVPTETSVPLASPVPAETPIPDDPVTTVSPVEVVTVLPTITPEAPRGDLMLDDAIDLFANCDPASPIGEIDRSRAADMDTFRIESLTDDTVRITGTVRDSIDDYVADGGFSIATQLNINLPDGPIAAGWEHHDGSTGPFSFDPLGQPLPPGSFEATVDGTQFEIIIQNTPGLPGSEAALFIFSMPTPDGQFACDPSDAFILETHGPDEQ